MKLSKRSHFSNNKERLFNLTIDVAVTTKNNLRCFFRLIVSLIEPVRNIQSLSQKSPFSLSSNHLRKLLKPFQYPQLFHENLRKDDIEFLKGTSNC